MGISINLIPLLLDSLQAHHLGGAVLMLGRQVVEIDPDGLAVLLHRERFPPTLGPDQWDQEADRVTPESFFRALGFASVASLDFDGKEGAEIVFDLNRRDTPPDLVGCCDILFDGGTLEHVFHLPNALLHCGNLLRNGGHFVHVGPMNGYVDHGFFQFSPTFWFDWADANGWRVVESVMVRLPSRHRREPPHWRFSCLRPGQFGTVGDFDDAPYLHFMIARKDANTRSDRLPVQRIYAGTSAPPETAELRHFAPFAVTETGQRCPIATKRWAERLRAGFQRKE
ncbi:hypothetical protein [Phaeospirillum tilakii]|uniref:Methyltransferase domain-containing protein n=1 Tax=Phaeospirillum tilakii TaxID=741673 RepID=A0ABW5CD75_9PROT